MIGEYNILIVGVGGTGVLTAAGIMATAAVMQGEKVREGEVHGMAQRGGVVQCNVRIGDKVYGPIVPDGKADLIIGFEQAETLRSLKKSSQKTVVVMSASKFTPTTVSMGNAEYPDEEKILEGIRGFTDNIIVVDAMKLAKEAGNPITANMVMLGAAAGTGKLPIKTEYLKKAAERVLPAKYVEVNLRAFEAGYREVAENAEKKKERK